MRTVSRQHGGSLTVTAATHRPKEDELRSSMRLRGLPTPDPEDDVEPQVMHWTPQVENAAQAKQISRLQRQLKSATASALTAAAQAERRRHGQNDALKKRVSDLSDLLDSKDRVLQMRTDELTGSMNKVSALNTTAASGMSADHHDAIELSRMQTRCISAESRLKSKKAVIGELLEKLAMREEDLGEAKQRAASAVASLHKSRQAIAAGRAASEKSAALEARGAELQGKLAEATAALSTEVGALRAELGGAKRECDVALATQRQEAALALQMEQGKGVMAEAAVVEAQRALRLAHEERGQLEQKLAAGGGRGGGGGSGSGESRAGSRSLVRSSSSDGGEALGDNALEQLREQRGKIVMTKGKNAKKKAPTNVEKAEREEMLLSIKVRHPSLPLRSLCGCLLL